MRRRVSACLSKRPTSRRSTTLSMCGTRGPTAAPPKQRAQTFHSPKAFHRPRRASRGRRTRSRYTRRRTGQRMGWPPQNVIPHVRPVEARPTHPTRPRRRSCGTMAGTGRPSAWHTSRAPCRRPTPRPMAWPMAWPSISRLRLQGHGQTRAWRGCADRPRRPSWRPPSHCSLQQRWRRSNSGRRRSA